MNSVDLSPPTLTQNLLNPIWRSALIAAIDSEAQTNTELTEAYRHAAAGADATTERLRELVHVLIAADAQHLLAPFVARDDMPEDVLHDLCRRDVAIDTLGHRQGPRSLLIELIERHHYDEAILTLGLDLYRDPAVNPADFAIYLADHADHDWLLRTLAEVDASDPAKEAIYEHVAVTSADAAAFHARHLATSNRHTPDQLARFLERTNHPRVLILLLNTDLTDPNRAALVCTHAEHCNDHRVQAELTRRHNITLASRPLTPEQTRKLLETNDPFILTELAGNPSVDNETLNHLAAITERPHAKQIRTRAQHTLRDRTDHHGPQGGAKAAHREGATPA